MLPRREEKLADPETGLTFWMKATESRFPWARDETRNQIRQWIKEAERADALHAAGERVYPLLLSGETRCGKTSTMCSIAGKHFGVPCFRMNIAVTIAPPKPPAAPK